MPNSHAAIFCACRSEGGKGKAGWKDTLGQADGGAAGRRRQQADALAAKSPSQGRTAAAAGAAGATLLQSGVDKGSVAAQPGRPRLEVHASFHACPVRSLELGLVWLCKHAVEVMFVV